MTMQFLIKAYDGEDMLEKRMAVRPRHLEGMNTLRRQVICAGGLRICCQAGGEYPVVFRITL